MSRPEINSLFDIPKQNSLTTKPFEGIRFLKIDEPQKLNQSKEPAKQLRKLNAPGSHSDYSSLELDFVPESNLKPYRQAYAAGLDEQLGYEKNAVQYVSPLEQLRADMIAAHEAVGFKVNQVVCMPTPSPSPRFNLHLGLSEAQLAFDSRLASAQEKVAEDSTRRLAELYAKHGVGNVVSLPATAALAQERGFIHGAVNMFAFMVRDSEPIASTEQP